MVNNFTKPNIDFNSFKDFKVRISQIPPLDVAFNTMALSEYELLVAAIYRLNELITYTNSYTELINEILVWVVNDGIKMEVLEKLDEWLIDGTLGDLINQVLFDSKADKEDLIELEITLTATFNTAINTLTDFVNSEVADLTDLVEQTKIDIENYINEEIVTKIEAQSVYVVGADINGELDSADIIQSFLNTGKNITLHKNATYLISKPLYLKTSHQQINGNNATLRVDASKGTPAFYIGATSSDGTMGVNVMTRPKIYDLLVRGFGNKVMGADAFYLMKVSNVVLDNIFVTGMFSGLSGKDGNATPTQSICNTFNDLDFRYNRYGIYDPLGDFQASRFYNGRIEANEKTGVLTRSNDIAFFGTVIEGNGSVDNNSPEIEYSGNGLNLNSVYMEKINKAELIRLDGITARLVINGGSFWGAYNYKANDLIKSMNGIEQDIKIFGGTIRNIGKFVNVINKGTGININIISEDQSTPNKPIETDLEGCMYYVATRNNSVIATNYLFSGTKIIGKTEVFTPSLKIKAEDSTYPANIITGKSFPWENSSVPDLMGVIYIQIDDTAPVTKRVRMYLLESNAHAYKNGWREFTSTGTIEE